MSPRLFASVRLLLVITCALWIGGDGLFAILATTAFYDAAVIGAIHVHGAGLVVGTTLAAWTTQVADVLAGVASVLALLLALRALTAHTPLRAAGWACAAVLTAACQWWSHLVVTQAMALLPHLNEPLAKEQFHVLHRQSAVAFGLAGVGALVLLLAAGARLVAPPGAAGEGA